MCCRFLCRELLLSASGSLQSELEKAALQRAYNAVSMITSITTGMKKTRAVIPMIAGIFR